MDDRFMRRALELAREGLGTTSPNPCVGAVLVRDGEVLAEGRTRPPPGNHAEREVLAQCPDARGATLYVTLEPCSHEGKRTPPCVDAIVAAGVTRVVVGMADPNPAVDGVAKLRDAGVEVVEGVLGEGCRELHGFYAKWIASRRPFVTLKVACTLDGKVAWGDGRRQEVSGDAAWRRVHELRREHDAVLVGVETVLKDDPQLTVRHVQGRNPLRVILDSGLRTPPGARVLDREAKTVIFCTSSDGQERYAERADVVVVDGRDGRVDLAEALDVLGELNVTSVLVEAGPTVAASFLGQGLVDRLLVMVAPLVIGTGRPWWERLERPFRLEGFDMERLGEDVLLSGDVNYEQKE